MGHGYVARAALTGGENDALAAVSIGYGDLGQVKVDPAAAEMLAGDGVNAYEAGEIWHLLDRRFDVPVTLIEPKAMRGLDLRPYTHLLLAGGSYNALGDREVKVIHQWIEQGGVLIAMKSAAEWAAQHKLGSVIDLGGFENFIAAKCRHFRCSGIFIAGKTNAVLEGTVNGLQRPAPQPVIVIQVGVDTTTLGTRTMTRNTIDPEGRAAAYAFKTKPGIPAGTR